MTFRGLLTISEEYYVNVYLVNTINVHLLVMNKDGNIFQILHKFL